MFHIENEQALPIVTSCTVLDEAAVIYKRADLNFAISCNYVSNKNIFEIQNGEEELQDYFRLVFPCRHLANDIQIAESVKLTSVVVTLKNLRINISDIEWVSFLALKHGRYRMFEEVFTRQELEEAEDNDFIALLEKEVLLKKMPAEADLFLGIHFKKLSKPIELEAPQISWERPDFLGLHTVSFEDRCLSVSGWARDEEFQCLPVRVELVVNGEVVNTVLARRPPDASEAKGVPDKVYMFKIAAAIPLFDTYPEVELRLKGSNARLSLDLFSAAASPQESQKETIEHSSVPAFGTIMGKVESSTRTEVTGWAMCSEEPDAPVDLILYVNGKPLAHCVTSLRRPDVQAVHQGNGFSGFRFEVPPNVVVSQECRIMVRPLIGHNSIRASSMEIKPSGKVLMPSQVHVKRQSHVASSYEDTPVSIIVLNRNCAQLLADLFISAKKHEDISKIEWIIIDHNSTDNSNEICEHAVAEGHTVRFIQRNGNFSFSDSNNFGARLAAHDVLIFANNDLVFEGPFREGILQSLANQEVGLVGVSLYDHFPLNLREVTPAAPLQHTGVYFNPMTTAAKWFRPYESRLCLETEAHEGEMVKVPAVTGAFIGMMRDDFDAISGFEEAYIYGLEDVDLCLKVAERLKKSVVVNNTLNIVHHRGFSRGKETNVDVRQRKNNEFFNNAWGDFLRRTIRHDVLRRPSYWTGARPVVGFIVADAGDKSTAGEYFTALELGKALQKIAPVHLRFLVRSEWEDLTGIDILVVMVQGFDLSTVKKASPFLVTINWTRQWFDRWAEDQSIYCYDIVFASSQRAADYLSERTGRNVDVLPIATDYDHFAADVEAKPDFECDYCLTGNWVGTPRAIEYQLKPSAVKGTGAIFGANWENTALQSLTRGHVPYHQMVNVYASTKIVIDDANIATKDWGSCNSRVFDAIAAGCLLITNGPLGVQELFGDLVPTFSDAASLTNTLNHWLEDDAARENRIEELREIVRTQHNYNNRAQTIFNSLTTQDLSPRIAIKIAAPFSQRLNWGDYHFAQSLANSLRKLGFVVTVDCLESWNRGTCEADDVVIVLRGLRGYAPRRNQHNILWIISHPRDIPLSEIEKYDQVFVASNVHCERLTNVANVPVAPLLQCTDITRFKPTPGHDTSGELGRPLFVGNSRGVFRNSVKWAVELELDIDLYGGGWEQFVNDYRLKGQLIPNEVLSSFYERSSAVLCDHWDDMKQDGYLSNRAFDVLACGGFLVVDDVVGIEKILPGGYQIFSNREELGEILANLGQRSQVERDELMEWVRKNHSFDSRAELLAAHIFSVLGTRAGC